MTQSMILPEHIDKAPIWGQLYGVSLSLALAEYAQSQPDTLLLITKDTLSAVQLEAELQFFFENDPKAPSMFMFPDWETLPYDHFSPHQDIISTRLSVLNQLQQNQYTIVITAITTLMHRLCPPWFLNRHAFMLAEGQALKIDTFRHQLQEAGYHHVNKVMEHGEFSVRGGILDLFPMGSQRPFRIEWFDDTIESLRQFDPESQRTILKIQTISVLPAREFPLNDDSTTYFRNAFREQFTGNPSLCPIYEAVSNRQMPGGIEYYLPLFFENTATLFDYLPKDATIFFIDSVTEQAAQFREEIQTRYAQLSHDITRPILKPDVCFLMPDTLFSHVKQYKTFKIQHVPSDKKQAININIAKAPALPIERKSDLPLSRLAEFISNPSNRYVLMVESAGRREVLLDLLKQNHVYPVIQPSWQAFMTSTDAVNILIGPVVEGAELINASISIITEHQIFGEQATFQQRSTQTAIDPDSIIRDLAELRIGAPVVHLQFGVGRYQGLQTIETNGMVNEFLMLTYAGDDKIYVPVTALNLISRYTGADSEHAPLHRLGTQEWQKAKKKAAEKIHDIAIELLDIYAKRAAKSGFQHQFFESEYQRFVSGFPFTETPDQKKAIESILQDLNALKPMDRLICGDVGFGKTEVAMRAAFLAVQNGKQVCVLVPTTLLAGQHFETFRDRFAEFPVHIELLSRFRSSKESEHVVNRLKQGQVDIVIGTHKLFQRHIQFHDLGLLIIDEEHRFGVKQKEQIKAMRTEVDVLSMTATPIPRTLNMAMAGIRDISLIATAPAKRLAIKTFWQNRNDSLLREAILREILRGGQVFFLHNNVQTIQRIEQDLQALVPEAKVKRAHGQMPERELERIMSDFYHHRFNVLVCTTIIETGIDIPTANTIIIDRADKFGLAQLHQLRGRVGRSHHQAYAYLLTPDEKLLTPDAKKRLEAIVSLEELGAGFTLATHDLEIRGAGELLGEEQSGNMHAIGFNLFMDMLDKAVQDLKSGKTPVLAEPIQQGPDIDLRLSAIIPEDYIGDIHTRLIIYKRIANAQTKEQLTDLQVELIDRFGLLPQPVKHLLSISALKQLAAHLNITRIQSARQQGKLEFQDAPNINPEAFIQLIQSDSTHYQPEGPNRLKFKLNAISDEARIQEIHDLLLKLSP